MGELATYGGRRSGEKVMSDGAIKINASGALRFPNAQALKKPSGFEFEPAASMMSNVTPNQ